MRSSRIQQARRSVETPSRRLFDLAGANRALVLVRRVVADIVAVHARLIELTEMVESPGGEQSAAKAREELVRLAERLHDFVRELDDVGVELKDWKAGVVDFPCLAGGREVRLCWRHGQDEIAYWHESDGCPGESCCSGIDTLPVNDKPSASLRMLPRSQPAAVDR
jgi:hypothetical protein